ncbi:hypothetical protein RB195_001040 [Necator americanus]|uniref:Reverse transcriptase domain-containing protein n=2 Tax=Necator americanus TaxID=51031 RepID=A0ABR1DCF6_NECAM
MESLATTIRFVTLNCRTLSSELQQAALSKLLRYLCVPFVALQETRMRDHPSSASKITPARAPIETAEDNSKDAFYDELDALMSKIPSQQVVIVGIDANAKMGLEQQSDVLGKWYYAAERTSDNGDRLVDLCEQTGLIIASTFKRNHRRHQLTWQGSTLLTPEEQRKRKMRTLKLQLDYVLARSIPQSDIRKSRAVWDVAFDSDHRPVLLSFKIRFHKRNRGVPLQPKIHMAGLKDDECRRKFRQRVSIHVGVRTRKKLSDADSFTNAGDFNQEKRLRRKLRRQLQQDRDNEWTLRAMEFEKAWEDRNPRKAYALLKHGIQLAFLDFEAAFDSPHRGRLLNALRADGVPGKFVRLLDDMNQRTTAAVRTPAGCTTPFEVVTGVRQRAVAGPFLFNLAIDDIMRRTVDQCPADIVLAPSGCPLTDLEYADDVVIFAESSTKLQHVVNLVSKLAAAYGLRLRPDKCKQM